MRGDSTAPWRRGSTRRIVAPKLLAEGASPSLRDRFLSECEAAANIRHEHVMPICDRDWFTEKRPSFCMELRSSQGPKRTS